LTIELAIEYHRINTEFFSISNLQSGNMEANNNKDIKDNESETLQEIYAAYAEKRDQKSRENLILQSLPLVKAIVERLAARLPSHLDQDDLSSAGLIGLMDAIDRYDPSREASFKTYASFRIKGAILDELRSMDWKPRSVRDKEKRLEEAYIQLEKSLKRRPTDSEIAEFLDMDIEEFYDILQETQGQPLLQLDELMEDGSTQNFLVEDGSPSFIDQLIFKEIKEELAEAINSLPEKEQLSITLYYYEGLTMKEIGQVLEVSESRISQIHSSALLHLRARLKSKLD